MGRPSSSRPPGGPKCLCAISPLLPTSIMARPLSSTCCSVSPAPSATTSGSRSGRWIRATSNASVASPSSPRSLRWCGRRPASTSSTPPATPTSAARWSASSPWSTASSSWWTPPRGRCRRPSSCCPRRWRAGCGRSSRSTRSTARTSGTSRCWKRSSTCSSRSTPPPSSSIFRCSTGPAATAGWPPIPPGRASRWRRCSTRCSPMSPPRRWRRGRSACWSPPSSAIRSSAAY